MRQARSVPARRASTGAERLAQGLGLFSLALGVAEVVAPRRLARPLGLAGQEHLVTAYGFREIATGLGILAARQPAAWLWARAAGDVMDLATLSPGVVHPSPRRRRGAWLGLLAVAGVGVADVLCARALAREGKARREARGHMYDTADRRGMPRPAGEMRGAARRDFELPRDFAIPQPLRPWTAQVSR